MLKIKDNVDLKELEKFRFKDYIYRYGRDIDERWLIIIDKKTRQIKNWNFYYGNYKKEIEKYIDDLIQAGLVENVKECYCKKTNQDVNVPTFISEPIKINSDLQENNKFIICLSQNPKCVIKIGDELEIQINKTFTDKQIKNIKEYFGLEVENIKGE